MFEQRAMASPPTVQWRHHTTNLVCQERVLGYDEEGNIIPLVLLWIHCVQLDAVANLPVELISQGTRQVLPFEGCSHCWGKLKVEMKQVHVIHYIKFWNVGLFILSMASFRLRVQIDL